MSFGHCNPQNGPPTTELNLLSFVPQLQPLLDFGRSASVPFSTLEHTDRTCSWKATEKIEFQRSDARLKQLDGGAHDAAVGVEAEEQEDGVDSELVGRG
jgi:hypothetical protein